MPKIKVALIGAGGRGRGLYRVALKFINDIEIVAVCDHYRDRTELISADIEKNGGKTPLQFNDYKRCIDETQPDVIVIATAWEAHLKIAIYAMYRNIAVACEVGGSYTIEELWELIKCYEQTKTPVMMMENCCYGRTELLALNMKRKGLLGKIVHCEGGYRHDLREEITNGIVNRHYRLQQYKHRNCDNYPTHGLGPIAKLLDINCGNRLMSLVSVGSVSAGLEEYIQRKKINELKKEKFNQADVVTTLIKCANGETITLTLDTALPRYYSRGFLVQGTKGLICEENKSVYLEKNIKKEYWDWSENFNNIDKYYKKYDHRLWKDYAPGKDGHGGIDLLAFQAFFKSLREGLPMPIDVYDMATWMSISVLTEEALLTGQTVYIPDFTNGKWIDRENFFEIC